MGRRRRQEPAAELRPFDIDEAVRRLRQAVAPFPKAALFELAEEGFGSVFELLVACIISVRTRDETTLPVARRLLTAARTPVAMARLSVEEIDELIGPSTFHEAKAPTLLAIARRAADEFGGVLPADEEVLQTFRGVGPKCANLVVGIAGGSNRVAVDIHVHRVTNRWGYVAAATPEKTMAALEQVLPDAYRVELNALLVPFGKHVCTGSLPRCSDCPLADMCRRVGVTRHR